MKSITFLIDNPQKLDYTNSIKLIFEVMYMATIKDVAQHAGVSSATVSRVLMNQGNVSEKTAAAVRNSIALLGYHPNALARQLRRQHTQTVYVIIPSIDNAFFSEVYRGIETEALAHNYQAFLVNTNNDKNQENLYISALVQKQTDGIISLSATAATSVIERQVAGLPMVIACQYLENGSLPNVAIDNIAAAKDAVAHLISLGHKKIGCLAGPASNVLYRDRLTGYLRALTDHAIPVNMEYVSYGDSTFQSGYEMARELLQAHPEITAVFASGDVMAIGSMKAAKELGRRIPQDYAVVGFDDLDITQFCDPPLTTIHQPMFEIGKYSMQTLLDLINGNPTQNQRLLEYQLIVRESTVFHSR